jgi:hypothetical protein
MLKKLNILFSAFLWFASPAQADCVEDLKAATQAAFANAPFRLDWQSEMDGETTTSSADVVALDRMRLGPYVMTPNGYFTGGSKISELDGDGRMTFSDLRPQVNVGNGNIEKPSCLGKTSFEGGSFTTYTFETEAALMGMMGKAQVSLYIDDASLPVWLLMNTKVPGVGEIKRKAKYSFDKSIEIGDP